MDYCDILLEEMYDPRGIQLATEQTWRELGIPVNLGRRLKEALHPYQKERRHVTTTEAYSTEVYDSKEEQEALQVLEAMRNGS